MLHRHFPDLKWLQNVSQAQASGPTLQWPHVVMNTTVHRAHRPHIRGPLSFFFNLRGVSEVRVAGESRRLLPGQYFLTQADEVYALKIDSQLNPEPGQATETLNIHFRQDFLAEVYPSLTLSHSQLLSEALPLRRELGFARRLNPCSEAFEQRLRQLPQLLQYHCDPLFEEEQLLGILIELLLQQGEIQTQLARLEQRAPSARHELQQRLMRAREYILSQLNAPLKLEELTQVAGLSRYHFLRLFAQVFGQTPYQFILQARLQLAARLLRQSRLNILEVALNSGFQSHSALTRQFSRHFGCSPQHYRQQTS